MKLLIILLTGIFSILIFGINSAYSQEITEYHLKVTSVPNIIFIGGGGFYNEGALVTLDAAPESWKEYQFVGWKIDSIWTDKNPPTIRMDKSHTAEAIYEKATSGGIIVDTIPRITDITIDGTIYLPEELPASFNWPVGSKHTIVIPEIVSNDPENRFIFASWKDKDEQTIRTIEVTSEDSEYIAIFKTQHYLKIISEHGNVLGGGWNDQGTSVTFQVESDIVYDKRDDNIRYSFNSWTGGDQPNSPINTIDFIQPTTIVASWVPEYRLNVVTNVPDYDLFGSGWYIQGKSLALIAETEKESDNSDTKYVFEKWVSKGPNPVIIPNAQSPTTTVQLSDAYVIEAQYTPSYKVNVWTPYGTPVGTGFYKKGEMATISLAQTEIIVDPGQVRKIFSNWDTHGARTMNFQQDRDPQLADSIAAQQNLLVFVDRPVNVTANWKSQYYLNVISDEAKADGEGWYDVGRFAKISINEKSLPPGMWVVNKFDRWTGDVDSEDAKERVLMNKPKTVEAEFREDNTPGIINTIILGSIAGVGLLVYHKSHKTDAFRNGKNKKQLSGIDNSKPFDQFFNTRKNQVNDKEDTPLIAPKKNIIETILSLIKKIGRRNI